MLQPWPRLSCSICESTLQSLLCVCPQLCHGMAGEGTLHQGDAFSTRAGKELQEHYLPVVLCKHQQMITLVTTFITCWAAHVKGAVQVGVNGHLHGYVEQKEWVRMKFLQLWLDFCMTIAKGKAISTVYGVCLEGHIQSTVWQSLCRHSFDCLYSGYVNSILGKFGKTPFTTLIFHFPRPRKNVSQFVCVRECLLWLSLSCRVQRGPNPEVKLSWNCRNQLICVSKPSVPVFAQFSGQHKNGSQVHKSFSREVLGLEAMTECETRLVSHNIKFSYWHFLWVRLSGKLQKAGKLLNRNFEAELRYKVFLNAIAGTRNGCLFVFHMYVYFLSCARPSYNVT